MDNLKPCPFCGSNDLRLDQWNVGKPYQHFMYQMYCITCHATCSSDLSKIGAIERWNSRVDLEHDSFLQYLRHELISLGMEDGSVFGQTSAPNDAITRFSLLPD